MRFPPQNVTATWPKPNYVNPVTQGPRLAIVGIIFLVLSFIVVSLRMYVRFFLRRSAGLDDWLLLAVMLIQTGMTALSLVATRFGWGIHIWDNKREWFRPSRIASWSSEFLYITLLTLLKVSILLSYLRFFTSTTYRVLCRIIIGIVVAWFIAYAFTLIFNCSPTADYWNNPRPTANCINEFGKLFSSSITNFFTDLLILALPIPTLWKLRLPTKERVILVILMSLGLLACIASAVKTYYIYYSVRLTYDVPWWGYNVWLWSDVEIGLAVICPSIPILRPLAQKYFPRLGFKTLNDPSSGDKNNSHTNNGYTKNNFSTIHRRDTLERIINDDMEMGERNSRCETGSAEGPMEITPSRARSPLGNDHRQTNHVNWA